MNTFLARTGSNSTCLLAHYHVGVCNLGGRVPAPPPLDPPLETGTNNCSK